MRLRELLLSVLVAVTGLSSAVSAATLDFESLRHDDASIQQVGTSYTEDGFVMSSGRPPVRGHEAIVERYAGARGSLNLRAMAFEISGSNGYIIGGYRYDPDKEDTGKFILALRMSESGRWLIAADIDNSNSR